MTVEIKPYLELDMEFSLTVICEYRSSKSVLRGKKRTIFILLLRVQLSDKFSLLILTLIFKEQIVLNEVGEWGNNHKNNCQTKLFTTLPGFTAFKL